MSSPALEIIRSEIERKEAEIAALRQALAILEGETCKQQAKPVSSKDKSKKRPHGIRDYGRPAPELLLDLVIENFPELKQGVMSSSIRVLAQKRLGMPAGTVSSALYQLTQRGLLRRDPESGLYLPGK